MQIKSVLCYVAMQVPPSIVKVTIKIGKIPTCNDNWMDPKSHTKKPRFNDMSGECL